ncbi:hypothetical protein RSP03_34290 [Cereibacter sphaeroides]|nr:hypothetical protein RSP03_34290 [Cereibacter sphaeroides]
METAERPSKVSIVGRSGEFSTGLPTGGSDCSFAASRPEVDWRPRNGILSPPLPQTLGTATGKTGRLQRSISADGPSTEDACRTEARSPAPGTGRASSAKGLADERERPHPALVALVRLLARQAAREEATRTADRTGADWPGE